MIKRTAIAASLLVLVSLSLPLNTNAQSTSSSSSSTQTSTTTQKSTGGPLRKLRNKIRSMRPRIKRREARKKAESGNTNGASTTAPKQ